MNVKQFRDLILRPTLKDMGLHSPEAVELLLGTAVYESGGLEYIHQLGGGPALGVYQMEPMTHDDIIENFLNYKPLQFKLRFAKATNTVGSPSSDLLVYNLRYATAMARLHYLRKPDPLPGVDKIVEQATYYKKHYNTHLGRGSVEGYIAAYTKWIKNAA